MGKTLKRQRKREATRTLTASHLSRKPIDTPASLKPSHQIAHISTALSTRRWDDAIEAMRLLRTAGVHPKLGAVQRWVRAADMCGCERNAARLLSAIVRVAERDGKSDGASDAAELAEAPPGTVRRFPDWVAMPQSQECAIASMNSSSNSGSGDNVVDSIILAGQPTLNYRQLKLAPDSFPAPGTPLPRIFAASPETFSLAADHPLPVHCKSVPFVPGAFMLTDVLSPTECTRLVALAEALGFRDDVDYATGTGTSTGKDIASASRMSAGGERAAGVVLMADPQAVLAPLLDRCRPYLPAQSGNGPLTGINARFRLYRYHPGGVYRPHVDGAWPASAHLPNDTVKHDAHAGRQWSRFTLVLYLNDDFTGGATTFFGAAKDAEGVLEARGVRPVRGAALVFPHGEAGCLVHEGSAVTRGVKYIVRTDVLYEVAAEEVKVQ